MRSRSPPVAFSPTDPTVPSAPADIPAAVFIERRRHPALRWLWRIAFGLLFGAWSLLLLAWLTLHWGILPRIEQWRPQIEARASQALGVPVTIGAIQVRSSGWVPAIDLADVVLHDRHNNEALRLPRISAALSARSLLALELRFEQLHIDGAALEVRRNVAGRFFVAGIEMPAGDRADGQPNSSAADWFFAQHELVIRNGRLRWIDELRDGTPLDLDNVDLVIRNGLRRHEVRLDATPPPAWGERFSVQGRFTQSLLERRGDWRRWSGTLHVALPRTDVAELRRHVALPFELTEGDGAVRAWIDLRGGELSAVTADLALRAVSLRLAPEVEPLAVVQLQGRVRAERNRDRLRLATEGLSFVTGNGVTWPRSSATLTLRHSRVASAGETADAAAASAFEGGALVADRLDLGATAQVAASVPLGTTLNRLIAELAPTGQVSSLSARWDGALDAPTKYQVKASVSGLAIAAAPSPEAGGVGRPGWRNAAIDLDADESGGKARLVLDKGALLLPGLFETSELVFDSLSTRLTWRIRPVAGAPPALEFALADTRFANADAQGELTSASWRSGEGSGFGRGARLPGRLELAGSLSRGRAAAVARYLPLGVPEAARRYVQGAVVDGRVAGATFKVKGDLWDFPFSATAGVPIAATGGSEFRIVARAEDVLLAYVPSAPGSASPWPPLSRVNGELIFERSSMTIRNAQARAFGVELSRVNGSIADLANPLLHIEGQARGPVADMLRYVGSTPISGWLGDALREASATGNGELGLVLDIPIDATERTAVQGRLALTGNDVRWTPAMPLLANAKARIEFSDKAFSIVGGSARVLGGEATFEGGVQADGTLRFTAQGIATADALRRAPEVGALSRLASAMSGQAPYRLAVGIVRGRTELTLTSPLTGIALDLPAPLNKAAEAAWPLRVETRAAAASGDSAQRDSLRIELGNVLQAQYLRDLSGESPKVVRGAIAVLDTLPPLPERGVHAVLNLPAVDGDAWQNLAERLQVLPGGTADVIAEGYLPHTVALRAQSFTSGGRKLTRLVAGASQDPVDATWRGNLDAEQLGGYIEYRAARGPTNPGRVHARLARLALPPADVASVETLLAQAPATVPALDIVVDDFELRGKKLGRVEIAAVNRVGDRGEREWHMDRFTVTNPDAQLSGTGQWQAGPGVGSQRMVMDFKLELFDGGAFLDRIGFGGTLRGGKGRLSGQLSWSGSPLALHTPSLDGRIKLALDAGQFLKAGPGAGRLLGVLSLQALPRRLLLDFRDVFQEGFPFDNIVGDVTIEDGVASTNNLRMRGVQAAVLMEGHADIGRETQDLRVLVVPEINAGTASLAYAVINPAVGLGTFLAQLFLRRPLMAASTREFTVQGSWADPQVERVERRINAPLPELEAPAAASAPKTGP